MVPPAELYIGYLSPELLDSWAGLNKALDRSDYNAVAILNYEETCIWRQGQGWSLIG